MAHPFASPKQVFVDTNGIALPGGKLYSYAAGTSTPLATYLDETEGSANTNPIILDALGRCEIWLGALAYKFVLKDSSDVTIWTEDNISHINPLSVTTAMIGAKQVTTAKIADSAVDTLQLQTASVTTAKIADSNITTGKIANDAVTTLKILDANVTTDKIAPLAITQDKRALLGPGISGSSGSLWQTGSATPVAFSSGAVSGFTMTIASPAVFTVQAFGDTSRYMPGEKIVFTTTGALPTGITASTTYYYLATLSGTTFSVSTTPGGAAINTSGSQSGTHSMQTAGLSVTIATTGRPVWVGLVDDANASGAGSFIRAIGNAGDAEALLQIVRDSKIVSAQTYGIVADRANPTGVTGGTNYFVSSTNSAPATTQVTWPAFASNQCSAYFPVSSLVHIDLDVAAGTHTYFIKMGITNGDFAWMSGARLVAYEL